MMCFGRNISTFFTWLFLKLPALDGVVDRVVGFPSVRVLIPVPPVFGGHWSPQNGMSSSEKSSWGLDFGPCLYSDL